MSIRFEWDPAKNDANQRKHGLRFEDVKAIFLWPSTRRDNIDDTYAGREHRFVWATKRERRLYREEMDQEP